jgi:ribosomal protein L35
MRWTGARTGRRWAVAERIRRCGSGEIKAIYIYKDHRRDNKATAIPLSTKHGYVYLSYKDGERCAVRSATRLLDINQTLEHLL